MNNQKRCQLLNSRFLIKIGVGKIKVVESVHSLWTGWWPKKLQCPVDFFLLDTEVLSA